MLNCKKNCKEKYISGILYIYIFLLKSNEQFLCHSRCLLLLVI